MAISWKKASLTGVAGVALMATVLGGCATGAADSASQSEAVGGGELPAVAVSAYPLAFIAEAVGGDQVQIVDLSTTGGHAHDMELAPAQIAKLSKASLALYLSQGFQPSVEAAIDQTGVPSLDGFATLSSSDAIDGDPHVWLNPLNIAAIGEALAQQLSEADPAHAATYEANAAALRAEMEEVDAEYATALAGCAGETMLTSHEAFGYLAARYDLDQVGVMGVDPAAEPSPARLREVKNLINERGITAMFVEPTGDHDHEHEDSENTNKIAATLGVQQLTLDPLEVQVNPNKTLTDVFHSNLESLQQGLTCAVS